MTWKKQLIIRMLRKSTLHAKIGLKLRQADYSR